MAILKAIANHSFKSMVMIEIDLPYFWVVLIDDLIEGYRPTRAGEDYILSSLCEVQIIEVSLKRIHICYCFERRMSSDDKKEIKDAIRFFYEKLDRYYHIIEFEGFEFIIDVKMNKIEAE